MTLLTPARIPWRAKTRHVPGFVLASFHFSHKKLATSLLRPCLGKGTAAVPRVGGVENGSHFDHPLGPPDVTSSYLHPGCFE